MKLKKIFVLPVIIYPLCFGQNFDPFIEATMDQVNLDSLASYVRILSGEDSVTIGDSTVLIEHRVSYSGNDLTAEYIKDKLVSFGLNAVEENFSESGRNVYSIQTGTTYPKQYFIYCAHYDAVTLFCADDNASGSAQVLEAARILSQQHFDYSIIYALWDEEEIGKRGSKYFASKADSSKMDILGIINNEMSGYDSDGDGLMDIHTRDYANSVLLSEVLYAVDSLYNLALEPVIYNPGTSASDQSSFWFYGYSAVEFCQAYYGKDYNPYYHTQQDRIDKFNMPYFHNMAKLGIGSLASLANANFVLSVPENNTLPNSVKINNFPNPFNSSTIIEYQLPQSDYISLNVFNSLGQKITNIFNGFKDAGNYKIHFNGSNLSSGVYFVTFKTNNSIFSHKILLLK